MQQCHSLNLPCTPLSFSKFLQQYHSLNLQCTPLSVRKFMTCASLAILMIWRCANFLSVSAKRRLTHMHWRCHDHLLAMVCLLDQGLPLAMVSHVPWQWQALNPLAAHGQHSTLAHTLPALGACRPSWPWSPWPWPANCNDKPWVMAWPGLMHASPLPLIIWQTIGHIYIYIVR